MNLNLFLYANIQLNISNSPLKFLVDSGAAISIIKENFLKHNVEINQNNRCNIVGISNNKSESFGTVKAEINLINISNKHVFHVVPQDFSIPCDGILGLDFFQKYKCEIVCHGNPKLLIKINSHTTSIPLFYSSGVNSITIPPRCEVIRKIELPSTDEELLILNQEIYSGIFVSSSIVSKIRPYVKILNINEEEVQIPEVQLQFDALSNYSIYTINNSNTDNKTEILNKLYGKFPDFVKNDLTELCSEYSDVFANTKDKITANKFYR